jgi:hydrogenase maturation protein HypF
MKNKPTASRFQVRGIVQGVGFRPFVYQLAMKYRLLGEVSNNADGVTIRLEGPATDIEKFHENLIGTPPPLAQITDVEVHSETPAGYRDFSITKSKGAAHKATLISPDMAVCDDCRQEMFDPRDRRFGYPFINCTNCGPRYTIIDDIPYDRPKTSMRHFRMCPECQAEYDDPMDRRFHAQPNACPVCGPSVALYDHQRSEMNREDPVGAVAQLLSHGHIVAIKGLGGFHLAVDATNETAVARLRQRKHREEKPLAMMAFDLDHVRRFAQVEPQEADLLMSRQRPIVLLRKKRSHTIAPSVTPGNAYFGVMLPYTPLHYLILKHDFTALVMTSGNLSEEPIAIDNDDAFERLKEIADYFLIHNRDIYLRSDDAIVRHSVGEVRQIRRSRGYVPTPVFLKNKLPPILACGAEQKNTVCLTRGNQAFLSQHIGDLENLATLDFFKQTIDHLKRILDIDPEIVAHDLHPEYLSTKYAQELEGVKLIGVQHHHAHVVSCMAEHKIEGPVIGLSCDGTGYGTDGAIWGGEILVATADQFQRTAHLKYVPMPGGAAAIREPWRMAISYLEDAYCNDIQGLTLPLLQTEAPERIAAMREMIQKQVNSPLTSSLGRLFDGVAAIIGLRGQVAFEGQAAMELEMIAGDDTEEVYDYQWESNEPFQILTAPIIRGVVADLNRGVEPFNISAKFHNTLTQMFTQLIHFLSKEHGIRQVVLSGGVFQNSRLLEALMPSLQKKNLTVFTQSQVPVNDGGIALGQAVVAANTLVRD